MHTALGLISITIILKGGVPCGSSTAFDTLDQNTFDTLELMISQKAFYFSFCLLILDPYYGS